MPDTIEVLKVITDMGIAAILIFIGMRMDARYKELLDSANANYRDMVEMLQEQNKMLLSHIIASQIQSIPAQQSTALSLRTGTPSGD